MLNTKKSPFKLYPEEKHFWSFNDYGTVLSVVLRLQPKTVLEFGPGNSTLALIEGGAETIDSLEDDWSWCEVYKARLEDRFASKVKIIPYTWTNLIQVPRLRDHYDLSLIDGPSETPRRAAVLDFCLARCAWVLVALESQQGGTLMLEACQAARGSRSMDVIETGPDAGSFALIGPAC